MPSGRADPKSGVDPNVPRMDDDIDGDGIEGNTFIDAFKVVEEDNVEAEEFDDAEERRTGAVNR